MGDVAERLPEDEGLRGADRRSVIVALFRGAGTGLDMVLHDWGLALGIGLVGTVTVVALLGPVLWPVSPYTVHLGQALRGPSASHPMGTDELGRDVLARFLLGARISLAAGASVAVASTVAGGILGGIAGIVGGFLEAAVMRAVDSVLAFPTLLLAVAVSMALHPSVLSASVGIAIASIPFFARLMTKEVLRLRHAVFVEAATVMGGTSKYILWRHIWPQTVPMTLVQISSLCGFAILTLAGLSFVGLGAQPPTPEWGAMITEGLAYVLTGAWWVSVFPGVGIMMTVVGLNLIADHGEAALRSSRQGRAS